MEASAVLLSGGLDSAVLAAAEIDAGCDIWPMHVRAGLAWETAEAGAIERLLAAPPFKGRAHPIHSLALDMREGQKVFHSLIVHYENDIPVQIEDRFVNALVAPEYLKQDFTLQTPYAYLNQVAPLTEGEHVVEAILAEPSECKLLQIEKGEPCLLIRRRTWSGRQPVTAARLIHPGSRHRLEGRFHK